METCCVDPLHVVNPTCAIALHGVVPHVESTLPSQLGYDFQHDAVRVEHNLRLGSHSQRYHARGRKPMRGTKEKPEEMIGGIEQDCSGGIHEVVLGSAAAGLQAWYVSTSGQLVLS